MTDRQKEFMAEAIRLAEENIVTGHGGPFGAVVVKDGKIIGRGSNLVTLYNDPTAHAEIVAIRNACATIGTFQIDGCEIYCSCEPCPMCLGAIYWARPDRIFYAAGRSDAANAGFDDDFIYDEIKVEPAKRRIPAEQFLRTEALKVFNNWSASDRKIPY
jgi:tRNA(Arg) A34 adenosine deaminase TadA